MDSPAHTELNGTPLRYVQGTLRVRAKSSTRWRILLLQFLLLLTFFTLPLLFTHGLIVHSDTSLGDWLTMWVTHVTALGGLSWTVRSQKLCMPPGMPLSVAERGLVLRRSLARSEAECLPYNPVTLEESSMW